MTPLRDEGTFPSPENLLSLRGHTFLPVRKVSKNTLKGVSPPLRIPTVYIYLRTTQNLHSLSVHTCTTATFSPMTDQGLTAVSAVGAVIAECALSTCCRQYPFNRATAEVLREGSSRRTTARSRGTAALHLGACPTKAGSPKPKRFRRTFGDFGAEAKVTRAGARNSPLQTNVRNRFSSVLSAHGNAPIKRKIKTPRHAQCRQNKTRKLRIT